MIVYKITNKINGKCYIGQTIRSLRARWSCHLKLNSHCYALNNAIKKYGKDNFLVEQIAVASTKQELCILEKTAIKELNSLFPNGYNLTSGGESPTVSDETRKKMSKAFSGKNNPMYGKKLSEEVKQKIRAARKLQNMENRLKEIADSSGNIYKSAKEVANHFKLNIKTVYSLVKKRLPIRRTQIYLRHTKD